MARLRPGALAVTPTKEVQQTKGEGCGVRESLCPPICSFDLGGQIFITELWPFDNMPNPPCGVFWVMR